MSNQKTYFLCVNEVHMGLLAHVLPGISYIECRALDIPDNKEAKYLVVPCPQEPEKAPVEAEKPPEEVKSE